jgi:hypothetical protein
MRELKDAPGIILREGEGKVCTHARLDLPEPIVVSHSMFASERP